MFTRPGEERAIMANVYKPTSYTLDERTRALLDDVARRRFNGGKSAAIRFGIEALARMFARGELSAVDTESGAESLDAFVASKIAEYADANAAKRYIDDARKLAERDRERILDLSLQLIRDKEGRQNDN